MMESKEQTAKIITERLGMMFKPKPHTRYTISAVDDPYDQTYNFFFESQKAYKRLKSTPIHTMENHDIEAFEYVINAIRKQYGFTIEFYGFAGQRWPSTFKLIERKKKGLE